LINPNNIDVVFNRGSVFARKGNFQTAIQDYTQSIEKKHKLPRALYNRALANLNLGKPDASISDLKGLVKIEPENAEAYLIMGVANSMKKDFKNSIPYYDKAISIKPNFAEAYFNRGVSKGNLNLHNEAIPDYNKAIELRNNYPEAYYSRAVSALNLQKTAEACADLKKARDMGYKAADELISIHCANASNAAH
jgi:tetratricopeptide (TPR) repeat protein